MPIGLLQDVVMKLLGNIVEFHDPCSLCELLNASRRGRIQRACVKRSRDHIQALVLVHVRVHQRRPSSASQDQSAHASCWRRPVGRKRVGSIRGWRHHASRVFVPVSPSVIIPVDAHRVYFYF